MPSDTAAAAENVEKSDTAKIKLKEQALTKLGADMAARGATDGG